MSKTQIIYKDIAPGAAEDAAVSATFGIDRSDPSLLPLGPEVPSIITLEHNRWILDGSFVALEDDQRLAFWSSGISGEDCILADPPVITAVFDQQYSSVGISLSFDPATGEHCTAVNIKWYQGSTLLADVDFAPDRAEYFCEKRVTSYNKVVITLLQTSLPLRRARLNSVAFGIIRTFDMGSIRSASVTNETDLLSARLTASSLKWTLNSRTNVDYLFQLKQPMEVWNGEDLIGVYYIDDARRMGAGLYDISCEDALGVLAEETFAGGVYSNKSAKALLAEIVGAGFLLDIEVQDTNLTGAILSGTKRDAMQQVLFAWGACASTDGRETIRVFAPSAEPAQIGTNRTFPDTSTETAAIVTRVVVTAHSYTKDSNGGVTINDVKYKDTTTKYTVDNPNVTATDKQNVVEVPSATLVSPDIGQAVAQRVYDYYARRNTNQARIVWKGERLGDCVTTPNAWGGTSTGNINSLQISLSNTIVATCRTVGV